MANGNGYTAEQIISAIEESRGFISKAAEILGCSRMTGGEPVLMENC